MAEYDLGTAKGRITIDSSDAERGIQRAKDAQGQFIKDSQTPIGGTGIQGVGEQAKLTQADINRAGSELQTTGVKMAGAGTLLLGAFGVAVKASADFEKQISAIGAVAGASGKELDAIREKALQLGADTAFSAGESAIAIEELARRGLTLDQVLGGAADATVALAAATGTDLTTSATIASNAMNIFSIDVKEMDGIVNNISGFDLVGSSVEDFGQALENVGPIAANVGLSFDDLTLAIAAMSKKGVNGAEAGTQLKTMLLNLNPVSKKQIDTFNELGLAQESLITSANPLGNAFFDAAGKAKGMGEISEILRGSLEGLSEVQKSTALDIIFGSHSITAATIIAGEGAAGFEELSKTIGEVDAADQAAARMDNLAGSLEQFKGSIETVLIQAGGPFQKVFGTILDIGTKLVNLFGSLPGPIQTALVALVAIGGAALVFAGSGAIILGTFLKFGGALKEFKAALAVAKQVGILSKAMNVLNLSFLANPVFLVIAAIVALGVALYVLYTKSETFRKFVDGLWQGIQKLWDWVLDFVKAIPEKIGAVIDWVKKNWDLLLPIFFGPLGAIILIIKRWGGDILDFFKGLPGRIVGAARGLWDGFVNLIKEFPGNVLGFISDGIKKIIGLFTSTPKEIAEAGKGVVKSVAGVFTNIFGGDDTKKEIEGSAAELGATVAEGAANVFGNKDLENKVERQKRNFEETQGKKVIEAINRVKENLRNNGDYRDGKWYIGDVAVGYSEEEDSDIILTNVSGLKAKLDQVGTPIDGGWVIGDISLGVETNAAGDVILKDLNRIEADTREKSIAVVKYFQDIKDALRTQGDYRDGVWYLGDVAMGVSEFEDSDIFVKEIGSITEALREVADYEDGVWKVGDVVVGFADSEDAPIFIKDLDAAKKETEKAAEESESTLQRVTNSVLGFFTNVGATVVGFGRDIPQQVSDFVGRAATFFAELPGKIVEFFVGLPEQIGTALSTAFEFVKTFGGQILESIVGFLVELPGKAVEFFGNFVTIAYEFLLTLPGKVGYAMGFVLGTLIGWGIALFQWAWNTGFSIVETIISFFASLPGRIWEFLQMAWGFFSGFAVDMWNRAWEMGSRILSGIVDFIKELPGKITEFISSIPGRIREDGGKAFTEAKDFGKKVFDGIIDFITDLPGKVKEILLDAIGRIKGLIGDAVQAAKDFGSGLWGGFKDGLGISSPSYIEKAMTSMNKNVREETKLLAKQVKSLQGIGNGIDTNIGGGISLTGLGGPNGASGLSAGGIGGSGTAETGAVVIHVQGPLVGGEFTVRRDEDILDISRKLSDLVTDEARAQGKKTINA